MEFRGRYFDGESSRVREVTVRHEPAWGRLRILGEGVDRAVDMDEVRVVPPLGGTLRVLALPGGGHVECTEEEALEWLFGEGHGIEPLAHKLERLWPVALVSVFVVVAALFGFFRYGVPWVGDRVAQRLPPEAEALIGRQVEPVLRRLGVQESALGQEQRQRLHALFDRLAEGLPYRERYELRFARWRGVPNAFALPGGAVVVTDELVDMLDDDALLAAVMAHELGHQVHRHSLRMIVQSASVYLVVTMALGDLSGVSALGAAIPRVLLDSGYSRAFEREADAFAFELLRDKGFSPLDFARAMERLAALGPARGGAMDYLSTHPPSDERIEAAREAAGRGEGR